MRLQNWYQVDTVVCVRMRKANEMHRLVLDQLENRRSGVYLRRVRVNNS